MEMRGSGAGGRCWGGGAGPGRGQPQAFPSLRPCKNPRYTENIQAGLGAACAGRVSARTWDGSTDRQSRNPSGFSMAASATAQSPTPRPRWGEHKKKELECSLVCCNTPA